MVQFFSFQKLLIAIYIIQSPLKDILFTGCCKNLQEADFITWVVLINERALKSRFHWARNGIHQSRYLRHIA